MPANFAKPSIPMGLMHTMERIIRLSFFEAEDGGQYRPVGVVRETFKGVVMPMSNKDLQYLPEGTYVKNSQKLYTNGEIVEVGSQFTDTFDRATYTVIQELTHGPIHPMKRYMVEKRDKAATR